MLLETLDPATITAEPFPCVDQPNAVGKALCQQLVAEFPLDDTISKGQPGTKGRRFCLAAIDALEAPGVSTLWKQFIASHLTTGFFHLVVDRFGPFMLRAHPSFEHRFGELRQLRVGVHQVDRDADILLEAQVCCNLPPVAPSVGAPIGPKAAHIDLLDKLFTCLWYLKPAHDDTPGGDLWLFRYADAVLRAGVVPMHRRRVAAEYLECIRVVPYEQNRLVCFVNTIHALHAWFGNRPPGSHPRLFFMVNGYVSKPLFDLVQVPGGTLVPRA